MRASSLSDSNIGFLLTMWRRAVRAISGLGTQVLDFFSVLQGLIAFALISFGVMFSTIGTAPTVIRPLVTKEVWRAGVRLLPMVLFLSAGLGLVVIGQTVSLLSRVGANEFLGLAMVTVVVREVGPMATALLLLSRIGTANVVELGTARATGEVESVEALGIDPIHYFVVPRVIGMALGTLALTVYMILGALVSGYLWAFLQNVPLGPADYFRQLAGALSWSDFIFLGLKTMLFGLITAVITCYHGLAQPLNLREVPKATVRAVAHTSIAFVVVDGLFIILYLLK